MNRNKELEIFEKDDWLSKERQRENRISAWDFDDSGKLRREHEENCDARNVAQSHRVEHYIDAKNNVNSIRQIDGDNRSKDILWFALDIVLLFALSFVNVIIEPYGTYLPLIVLFLAINPGIFIWLFVFKRFPPERYSKTIFIVVIILQVVGTATNYFAYY